MHIHVCDGCDFKSYMTYHILKFYNLLYYIDYDIYNNAPHYYYYYQYYN